MRVVEKYASFGEHLASDFRVQKYGMLLVKHGLKGAAKKINPVALWVDAGLAVIDAGVSYLNYAKEREITRQIKLGNKIIKEQLDLQLQQLKLQNSEELAQGEERLKIIELALRENKETNKQVISRINNTLEQAKLMQQIVKKQREDGVNFDKLQEFQRVLDGLIRASLVCLMTAVDDTDSVED